MVQDLMRRGKTTGGEPLIWTKMRDFSSKGSTTEAFLLVVTVGVVQSVDVAVHTCDCGCAYMLPVFAYM
jgi:hypothetical protein